jgi:hypothetical protein
MFVSRPLTALALGAFLLTPGLALAQQPPRLLLAPADTDHDGHISDAERAVGLAETTADIAPVAAPVGPRHRARPTTDNSRPGPLDMARRVVPASEFELALEERFNREVERRQKD